MYVKEGEERKRERACGDEVIYTIDMQKPVGSPVESFGSSDTGVVDSCSHQMPDACVGN